MSSYISVYTRCIKERPSCYYRIGQYIEKILDLNFVVHDGFSVGEYKLNLKCSGKKYQFVVLGCLYVSIYLRRMTSVLYDLLHKPDVIVIQREVMPRYMPVLLGALLEQLLSKTKVIWDFDDHIFMEEISKIESKILAEKSDQIVVISDFLKNLIDEKYRYKVILMPTTDRILKTDELETAISDRKEYYDREIRIVWVGTSSNLYNLDLVMDKFEDVASVLKEYGKKLELCIVCNKPYEFDAKELKIINIEWSREKAYQAMFRSHIGIMPLTDNESNRGKGGFKMIQYLSAGLPTIGSDVGYNHEILSNGTGHLIKVKNAGGWKEAILYLSINERIWEEECRMSYESYKKRFNVEHNMNIWKKMLEETRA